MELEYRPRGRKPPRRHFGFGRFLLLAFLMVLLVAIATACLAIWTKYVPNRQHVAPDFHGFAHPVFYEGRLQDASAIGTQESLKLPLAVVQAIVDPHMIYDDASGSVIITTADKVIQLKTGQLTAKINDKPFNLTVPAEKKDSDVYVPIQPLKDIYHLVLQESPKTGAVILQKAGDAVSWGTVQARGRSASVQIRQAPSVKSPIVADAASGDQVRIWKDTGQWFYVQLNDGVTGYISKTSAVLDRVEQTPQSPTADVPIPWSPLGGKINMTWEQVYNSNPDTSKIGEMPGLNVISPTWFQIAQDEDGKLYVQNSADAAYAKWAHDRDYQIWALFSNGFKPDWTSQILSSFDSRMNIIRQLVSYAQMYHLQGINIDFENVNLADKDKLTEFIRELTPFLHEQGLVVSMDVTVRGGSANWSLFYDRGELGKVVDYMIVMAYDEHAAGSSVAGSVASLPWTEKGVRDIIEQDHVPAGKIMLAVPFYTRVWTEQTKDGKQQVSSRAVFMSFVERTVAEKKLQPTYDQQTGQDYIEYTDEDGNKARIWIENAESIQERIDLVKEYGLAGVASWSRGYETPDIWNVIADTLKQKP